MTIKEIFYNEKFLYRSCDGLVTIKVKLPLSMTKLVILLSKLSRTEHHGLNNILLFPRSTSEFLRQTVSSSLVRFVLATTYTHLYMNFSVFISLNQYLVTLDILTLVWFVLASFKFTFRSTSAVFIMKKT